MFGNRVIGSKLMHKLILCFLVLLFTELVIADISINEVMYNPEGNDNNLEYVELLLDSPFNLTDYIIEDSGSADSLQLLNYCNTSYALIVEEGFNYTGINASVYSVGATIGNNLNNDEDLVIIRDQNSTILDVLHYYSDWGADGNGNSLCKRSNVWQECIPSPGLSNTGSAQLTEDCDWAALVILNGTVFENPEFQIKVLKLKGEGKANLTVDKWIEDSRGNLEKLYSPWNIEDVLNYKTSSKYNPSLAKGDAYFIKANITGLSCQDTNHSNNFAAAMIFLSSEDQSSTYPNSSIKILEISPSSVTFGEIIEVKINVYRGDTLKYAVYAYAENEDGDQVSEKTTMHFKDKFTNYTLTVPIQIESNCNQGYEDGKHTIIVEGLDVNATATFDIEGINDDLCEIIDNYDYESDAGIIRRSGYSYELISLPRKADIGQGFKSVVKITNSAEESVSFDVWSYVYRGSKCYSGEREDNLQTVLVPPGSSLNVELTNKVVEADQGDYKLKIKIKHEDFINPKEITQDIQLIETEKAEDLQEEISENETVILRVREPKIVYESSSYKAKSKTVYFFMSALAILTLILLWKK